MLQIDKKVEKTIYCGYTYCGYTYCGSTYSALNYSFEILGAR
jgi:hypothetical protein